MILFKSHSIMFIPFMLGYNQLLTLLSLVKEICKQV